VATTTTAMRPPTRTSRSSLPTHCPFTTADPPGRYAPSLQREVPYDGYEIAKILPSARA
jgi:hypothetical protein